MNPGLAGGYYAQLEGTCPPRFCPPTSSLPSYIVMEIRVDLLDKRAQEPPEHRHLCFVEG